MDLIVERLRAFVVVVLVLDCSFCNGESVRLLC